MRWLWRRRQELCEPRQAVNLRLLQLETAKEILAEVFHARPSDVEEMIQRRLEGESRQKYAEGPWPATFCLGE